MNTESLCEWKENENIWDLMNNDNPYAKMVLEDWRKTNSPFWNYWGLMMYDTFTGKATNAFKNYILPLGEDISLAWQIAM